MRRLQNIICALIPVLVFSIAASQVPRTMNYQGKLTDPDGIALDDTTLSIAFGIYNAPESGTMLWAETLNVFLTNGLFNVILGNVHPIDLNFSAQYYIELTIEDERLMPRNKLSAIGYAFRAVYADSASGTGDFIENQYEAPQVANSWVSGKHAASYLRAVPFPPDTFLPEIGFIKTMGENETYGVFTYDGDCWRRIWKPDTVHCFGEALNVNAGENDSICEGDTVALRATANGGWPPYEFDWSYDGTGDWDDPTTIRVSPTSDSTFTLQARDLLDSASTTDSVIVFVTPLPTAPSPSIHDTTICFGDSTILRASVTAEFYSWRADSCNGPEFSTLQDVVISPPIGNYCYYLLVGNPPGCWSDCGEPLFLTVYPVPLVPSPTAVPNPVPEDSSTTLYANTAASGYSWRVGSCTGTEISDAQNLVVTPTSGTTYYLKVRNEYGCWSGCGSEEVIIDWGTFAIAIGTSGDDYGYNVVSNTDGSYTAIGQMWSAFEGWLVNVDSLGNFQWSNTIQHCETYTWGSDILLHGSDLIVTGFGENDFSNHSGLGICKLNSTGELQWGKVHYLDPALPWYEREVGPVRFMEESGSASGYGVAGEFAYGMGSVYVYGLVARFNTSGDVIWTKYIEDDAYYGVDIRDGCKLTGDYYVIVGDYGYSGPGGSHHRPLLAKFNASTGAMSWVKEVYSPEEGYAHSICATSDGGYLVAINAHEDGILLIKYNSSDAVLWTRHTPSHAINTQITDIKELPDGSFVIAGGTDVWGEGWDLFLMKLNSTCNSVVWSKTVTGNYSEDIGITLKHDGGFVLCGKTSCGDIGGTNMFLIEFGADGSSCLSVDRLEPTFETFLETVTESDMGWPALDMPWYTDSPDIFSGTTVRTPEVRDCCP